MNNPVENNFHPVALGRYKYLFAGSHEAAKRSGMLYWLFGTCKMHCIEPYAWLKDCCNASLTIPLTCLPVAYPYPDFFYNFM